MPISLAVETSGRHGSIALGRGATCVEEVAFSTERERARDLLPAIDALVSRNGHAPGDIEHCYVSVGPGSFTGLRVAVTFARHLALATGAKLVAVPTMDCIAQNARQAAQRIERAIVILPARKGQMFAASYRRDGEVFACELPVRMAEAAAFFREAGADGATIILGEGVGQVRDSIEAVGAIASDEERWHARAGVVYELGQRAADAGRFIAPQDLVPLYVRRPEAEEVWERRAAASDHDL